MKKTIKLYADGCCLRNPGVGGWAAILIYGPHRKELSGGERETTNNRMELTAVIRGLEAIKKPDLPIEVFTDSQYVRNGISEWIKAWKRREWKTASKKPVKNIDLWVKLDRLSERLGPTYNWIPGHSGIPENERADCLANKAARDILTKPF